MAKNIISEVKLGSKLRRDIAIDYIDSLSSEVIDFNDVESVVSLIEEGDNQVIFIDYESIF